MTGFEFFPRTDERRPLADIRHYGAHERCNATGIDPNTGAQFLCSIRKDTPHTVHEAASAMEISARWEGN